MLEANYTKERAEIKCGAVLTLGQNTGVYM